MTKTFNGKKFGLLRTIFMVFIAAIIMHAPASAQECKFKRQSVNMKIEQGHLLISGMYFISGIPGEISSVSFPFVTGSAYGEIDSLHVFDVTKAETISSINQERKSMTFSLEFDDDGECLIQVYYRQKLLGTKAEYPFNSTVNGSNQLEKACFYLIAPSNLEVRKFNYTPKDTIDAGENIVYYWEMHDFTPEENFEFRFKRSDY